MHEWIDETLKDFKDDNFDVAEFIKGAKSILRPKIAAMVNDLKASGADKATCQATFTLIWFLNGIAWDICVREALNEKMDD